MAAGLALHPRHLSDFRRGLSDALADCVARAEKRLTIDAVVTLPELNLDLLKVLQKLAPFGPANPPITLALTNLTLQNDTVFGRTRAHRRVNVADEAGHTAQVIWWNSADKSLPQSKFDLALTVSRDHYRATEAIQLVWVAAHQQAPVTAPPRREVIDLRQQADLQFLLADPEAVFWTNEPLTGVRRLTLTGPEPIEAKKLVIWQAPPGQDVLQETIAAAAPGIVYLVARPTELDSLTPFIRRLMGMVKYALKRYSGHVEINVIAEAMAHREATVRLGLEWLVNQGKLRVIAQTKDTLVVRLDNAPPLPHSKDLQTALRALLGETAAYRTFVRSAQVSALGLEGDA
jgi:single-stranded-DNA-specific exonuclease